MVFVSHVSKRVGREKVFSSVRTLVFTRASRRGVVWIFLNNAANATASQGQRYCPAPSARLRGWYDALSGAKMDGFLTGNCFESPDRLPKVLYRQ